jgi:hypothetical protein
VHDEVFVNQNLSAAWPDHGLSSSPARRVVRGRFAEAMGVLGSAIS